MAGAACLPAIIRPTWGHLQILDRQHRTDVTVLPAGMYANLALEQSRVASCRTECLLARGTGRDSMRQYGRGAQILREFPPRLRRSNPIHRAADYLLALRWRASQHLRAKLPASDYRPARDCGPARLHTISTSTSEPLASACVCDAMKWKPVLTNA